MPAAASRSAGVILDEFVAVSGYHRKHAIRFGGPGKRGRRRSGGPAGEYGNAVREALIAVWEASDRQRTRKTSPTAMCEPCSARMRRSGALTRRIGSSCVDDPSLSRH